MTTRDSKSSPYSHPPLSLEGLRDQFRANMRGHASNLPNAHCTRLCLAEVDRFLDALEPFLQCASARREEPEPGKEVESRMVTPGEGNDSRTARVEPAGSAHSPLPWATEDTTLDICTGIVSVETVDAIQVSPASRMSYAIAYVPSEYHVETQRANAEFIVRAVNSHEELVAALEGLRALIIGECGKSTYECVDGERADAALAKAEG
jgi:hypothetical protein